MKLSKPLTVSSLALVAFVSQQPALCSVLNTLHFDEAHMTADGLAIAGVRFNYSFGGTPSANAVYGDLFAFPDDLVDEFVLDGTAQSASDPALAGNLTFTFFQPTNVLNFAVVLATQANSTIYLVLYNALDQPFAISSILTSYNRAGCNPSVFVCLSEAEYMYSGLTPVSRALLNFGASDAQTFAIDNLQYQTSGVPEPATWTLLLAGPIVFFSSHRLSAPAKRARGN